MKRRLVTIAFAVFMLLGFGAPAADAAWGCIAIDSLDLGACVGNPLPPRLPAP